MAFADAANRRVARHLPQGLDIVAEQKRGAAHAGGSQGGFGAGVAAADNNHVKLGGVDHGALTSGKVLEQGAVLYAKTVLGVSC